MDRLLKITILLFTIKILSADEDQESTVCSTAAEIRREMFYADKYNKYKIPNPADVELELHVKNFYSLCDTHKELQMDLFVRESWNDRRLMYDNLCPHKDNSTFNSSLLEEIWTPGLTVINAKAVSIGRAPTENHFVMVTENGTVVNSYQMRLTIPCWRKTTASETREHSTAHCTVAFGSILYNSDEVTFEWSSTGAVVTSNKVGDYKFDNFTKTKKDVANPITGADEVQLRMQFVFKRSKQRLQAADWHRTLLYPPSTAIVVLSWFPFLLSIKYFTARALIGVGAAILLAIQYCYVALLHASFANGNPSVMATSFDSAQRWLHLCGALILGSLMQLALIGFIFRSVHFGYSYFWRAKNEDQLVESGHPTNEDRKKSSKSERLLAPKGKKAGRDFETKDNVEYGSDKIIEKWVGILDVLSLLLFPILFGVYGSMQ